MAAGDGRSNPAGRQALARIRSALTRIPDADAVMLDKADVLAVIGQPCKDCFVHYRHGDPSPWTCRRCGTGWIVRDRNWVRFDRAHAARQEDGDAAH